MILFKFLVKKAEAKILGFLVGSGLSRIFQGLSYIYDFRYGLRAKY